MVEKKAENEENVAHNLLLTPWWDMEMGAGETVQVDCGIYTGGYPEKMTLQWLYPNGTVMVNDTR